MINKVFRSTIKLVQPKKRAERRRNKSRSFASYENLQPRLLLAGIFFDSATGTVTVAGGSGDDVGRFWQLDSTTYRATLAGVGGSNFAISDVEEFVFIGFAGDDTVNNLTDVPSQLLGHGGSDVLRGGGGDDFINGGGGDNNLFGNGGDDRIIGLNGDDRISGGAGDDKIFAENGTNIVRGGEGDDLIFGGSGVDTIYGEDGIDKIFSLGGNDILSSGDGGVVGSTGTADADLILGHDGDDRFVGGGGLNVFYGGNGNDVFIGGVNAENRMHGQNDDDELTGGSNADYIAGHAGNDIANGLGGDDYIDLGAGNDVGDGGSGKDYILLGPGNDTADGGAGNDYFVVERGTDTVDGESGNDVVEYRFDSSDYAVSAPGSSLTVENGVDGRDQIDNVESMKFSDGFRGTVSHAATEVVVQPIIVSNNNGSNRAEFFGNASQEAAIKRDIDRIYADGDIDIQWLPTKTWRNTFANIGDGGTRPSSDLTTIITDGDEAGVGSSDPLVIDMYFVEISAGFGNTSEYAANGVAYVGFNGITMHTGDRLPGLADGRDIVARVAAHEIAHNLGLRHVVDSVNLMDDGRELTLSQYWTMHDNQFTVPTDEVAAHKIGHNEVSGQADGEESLPGLDQLQISAVIDSRIPGEVELHDTDCQCANCLRQV